MRLNLPQIKDQPAPVVWKDWFKKGQQWKMSKHANKISDCLLITKKMVFILNV